VTDKGGGSERVPHVRDAALDSDIDGRGLKTWTPSHGDGATTQTPRGGPSGSKWST